MSDAVRPRQTSDPERYGRVVILGPGATHGQQFPTRYRQVRCDCGTEFVARFDNLRAGNTTSCGCAAREKGRLNATRFRVHGETKTPLHKVWTNMRQRCRNPKDPNFHSYGGRGITICPEWEEFIPFAQWARGSGFREDLTIERREVNGNYCPDNCCWIPLCEQAQNTRRSRKNKPKNSMRKPQFLVVSKVKARAKARGKRVGADFLALLDRFVMERIEAATEVHNGGRKTLDASVAGFVGIKPRGSVFGE